MNKSIPFPDNLIYEIFGSKNIVVNDDTEEAVLSALDCISLAYKNILLLRYRDYKTYDEVAEALNISANNVRRACMHAFRILRRPVLSMPMIYGKAHWAYMCREKEIAKLQRLSLIDAVNLPIDVLALSVRSYNGLYRSNLRTVKAVADAMQNNNWHKNAKQIGIKSKKEIEDKVNSFLSAINNSF